MNKVIVNTLLAAWEANWTADALRHHEWWKAAFYGLLCVLLASVIWKDRARLESQHRLDVAAAEERGRMQAIRELRETVKRGQR